MNLFADLSSSIRRPDHWLYASWLDTVTRYRRNRLGLFWLFVPTIVYIWGVGGFMGAMQAGLDLSRFYAYIAVGYAMFRLASTVLMDATSVFASSQAYIYDGSLRLTDFLLRSLSRSVYYFLLTSPVVAVVVLGSPDFAWAGVLPALGGLVLVISNLVFLSVLFGLLGARMPDLHEFTGSAMLALFLLTPIVWMTEAAPEGTVRGALMRANPLFHMLEVVRAPLLSQPVELLTYAYLGGMTVGGIALSTLGYRRFARRVPVWL
jgi:ABC-type polysaccharide/polyol phosphate export permease